MNALLLAAGFGTRLGNLTLQTPKCLMKVGGVPMLALWLDKLDKLGVEKFFINTHHLADQVEAFISSHPLKNRVTLWHETKLLGTAGTILKNLDALQHQDCFIVHVDNFCDDPLTEFLLFHNQRPHKTALSMLTFTTDTPESCGIVETDSENRLIDFKEKQPSTSSLQANAAIYIASPNFFSDFGKMVPDASDFSLDVIPKFFGQISCFHTKEFFADIGTKSNLEKANQFAKKKERDFQRNNKQSKICEY